VKLDKEKFFENSYVICIQPQTLNEKEMKKHKNEMMFITDDLTGIGKGFALTHLV
jgi:hypothetical protein